MKKIAKKKDINKMPLWILYCIVFLTSIGIKLLYEMVIRRKGLMSVDWKDIGYHGLACIIGLLIFHFIIMPIIKLLRVKG